MRTGTIHRVTGETDVRVSLNLDGTGRCQASTGVPFLDHMLHQISSHGLIDLAIEHNCTLCSADNDFRRFPGLRFRNPLL